MCWDRQCAHLSPYLSISTLLYGYLKLLKATRKGKKSKQGFELTPGNRSRDLPHWEGRALTDCALSLLHVRSFITTFYFRYLIWTMYLLGCSQIQHRAKKLQTRWVLIGWTFNKEEGLVRGLSLGRFLRVTSNPFFDFFPVYNVALVALNTRKTEQY